ncbi:hypothetical protein FJZ28_02310 [Candidatus Peregrinibacteria bacterium]|nr:hypothetical protein [Candidatus Peregrinibacteria bacterium]
MSPNALREPSRTPRSRAGGKKGPPAFERQFASMRGVIRDVLPDADIEAWTRTTENFEEIDIARPADTFAEWKERRFEGSDEFSQLFTQHMFLVWEELEHNGFVANDRELWEHQKALFAWTALNICTGTRRSAKLLIRSPYGSGKSLVTGLIARAFRNAQLALLQAEGVNPAEVPAGAVIGMRMEHMVQNARGEAFSVLQPPYNVERSDINRYWKDLASLHGDTFTQLFPQPTKPADPFYRIFRGNDGDEEGKSGDAGTVQQRIDCYLEETGHTLKKPNAKQSAMLQMLRQLAGGEIVLIPNDENVLQPHPAQLRDDSAEHTEGLRGDSAHAIEEGPGYHIKASHKHLAPDPTTYSTAPDPEALFAIVHGTALSRVNLRLDMAEFAKRCRLLLLDEAGQYNPGMVCDTVAEASQKMPVIVGVTAQDKGIQGWDVSPSISRTKMIELGLMKPIAYATIGDAAHPPSAGSEQAWKAYEQSLFEDYETAKHLGVEQPHDMDTVTIVSNNRAHEYARRIRLAHARRGVPVEVFVFHPDAGERKMNVLKAFKAPKKEGDPRRILVATEEIAFSHSMPNVHCIDFADDISMNAKEQAAGRLGHVRNDTGSARERAVARTVVREQHFHKCKELYIRRAAKQNGFTVSDEHAVWSPMHIMIDGLAYQADEERQGLAEPVPIADTPQVRRRKQRTQADMRQEFVGDPLVFHNPHAAAKEARRMEKQRLRLETRARLAAEAAQSQNGRSMNVPSDRGEGQRHTSVWPTSSNGSRAHATPPAQVPVRSTQLVTPISVKEGADSITIHVDEHGWLTQACITTIASMAPTGYENALYARIAYDLRRENLRGEALARAVIGKLNKVRESADRHSKIKPKEANSRYIGVKTPKLK